MTPELFKIKFPEFAGELDQRIQSVIDDSEPYFDHCKWGYFYESGVGYWVAHQITIANNRATTASNLADGITSSAVGDVSYSKDSKFLNESSKDPYLLTSYGQEYRKLSKVVGLGAVSV